MVINMIKIGYKGNMKTFRVKVGDSVINRWNKDEIREFSDSDASHLLNNKNFYVVDGKMPEVKQTEEEMKSTEKVEEKEEAEIIEEEVFDYENVSKDELLDFTAVHGIEADYSMTKTELRKLIKEFMKE